MLTGTTSAGTLTSAKRADEPAASVASLEPPATPAALGKIATTPTEKSRQRAVTRTMEPQPSRGPSPVDVLGGRAGGIFRLLINCGCGAPRHAPVCVAGAQKITLDRSLELGSGRWRDGEQPSRERRQCARTLNVLCTLQTGILAPWVKLVATGVVASFCVAPRFSCESMYQLQTAIFLVLFLLLIPLFLFVSVCSSPHHRTM